MKKLQNLIFKSSLLILLSFCSASSSPELPSNFNDCTVSLDEALNQIEELKVSSSLSFDVRIVREITNRDECIDMILGTNLPQGSKLENGKLVDLVVGIKKDEVTESVKESEYDLYINQLKEKNIQSLNLIVAPSFGSSKVDALIDERNVVTYIKYENPLGYKFLFSEAEGFIYGVDSENNINMLLDISQKTIRNRESGLHTFDFLSVDSNNYLIVTYTGIDNKYYFSAFQISSSNEILEEKELSIFELQNDNNVHFGGKILQNETDILLCLGDLNSPGNSAKFDSPWGKVLSFPKEELLQDPILSFEDSRISFIAYGLRNPWSCFFQGINLVIPDVGNSHWEEINILENYKSYEQPVFFGWPWYESYFDSNYQNMPVDEDTKISQLANTIFPKFLYPHANDYCAIIGGTELIDQEKWKDYFFVGDFCTGTIWAINTKKNSEIIVLDKNLIPYSITTINDSGEGTLLVGTTSGQVLEINLP